MTTAVWTEVWWYWLLAVAASWVVLELGSILVARLTRQSSEQVWTLSDTIRRWSVLYRWLAPLAVGVAAMLVWHFFAQANV
jgi:hypothetical protein